MGKFKDSLKTAVIPAAISLAAYLLLFCVLVPLVRSTRQRYARYLPLTAITAHTSSLRDRLSLAFIACAFGSRRRRVARPGDDDNFDEDEGEGMVGFEMDPSRRALYERQPAVEREERLNRDLEAGFRDDSDLEEQSGDRRLSRQR